MYDFVFAIFAGVYHMSAFLLAGEDYEWASWPMRVFRLGGPACADRSLMAR